MVSVHSEPFTFRLEAVFGQSHWVKVVLAPICLSPYMLKSRECSAKNKNKMATQK
jgi:hypothetical protein